MSEKKNSILTNKILVKNTLWSFFAQGLPIFAAVFTLPFIIKGLGTDRFSILVLILALIGYSSLFDLGLGRALTQLISKKIGQNSTEDMPVAVWTAFSIINLFGLIGTIILAFFIPFIVYKILKVPLNLVNETIRSLWYMVFSLPLIINIVCMKGVLEAYQKFKLLTVLRLPVILFSYVAPLFVLPFTNDLSVIVAVVIFGRVVTFFAHIFACASVIKDLFQKVKIDKDYIKPLLKFGSWITVSNIVSPIMLYLDRFFIASLVSSVVVAYYATPHEVISKLWMIPAAINGVVFPALSTEFQRNKERAKYLYYQSIKYTSIVMLIPVLIIVFGAKFGLTLWINEDFALKSYKITQWLAIGSFIYSINMTSYSFVQSTGRSDITAWIHIIEVPLYLFFLWMFIKKFGIIGAAYAWVLRILIDSVLLFIVSNLLIKENTREKTV